ncbi:MAG TPA: pseudoazurin [Burkholderiaceae bacterium]
MSFPSFPSLRVLAAALLCGACCVAQAAEVNVQPRTVGKGATMVFQPALVKLAKGDTLHLEAAAEGRASYSSIHVPQGATALSGKASEEQRIVLSHEGVYLLQGDPDKAPGMVLVVQVGAAGADLAAAQLAAAQAAPASQTRFKNLLGGVK